jgi:hypothetical protein
MTTFTTSRRVALACALVAIPALGLSSGSQAATASSPSPKPPSVYTGGSAGMSTTTATLKGGVIPHGVETGYFFQYGTTTAYGAQTPTAPAGNGTAEVKVSQPITGLAPGTTYHYRIVATSAAGTTDGQDAYFTTKTIPLTFTIAATPKLVVFGSSFSVSGVLSGTDAADHEVVLQSTPFPYLRGFKATGNPTMTNASGGFSFSVAHLTENTELRVATVETPPVNSHAVIERVAVRVSMHVSSTGRPGFARLYGAVEPAEVGARVGFQLLRPGVRPLTVASTKIGHASASASQFSRVVRIRHAGLYRAIVWVDNGKQVPGHSRAILIR